jgi:hypothetical protein
MAVAAELDAGLLVIGADAAGCRVLGERRRDGGKRRTPPVLPGQSSPRRGTIKPTLIT